MPHLLFLPGATGAASFWRGVGERLPREWEKTYLSWPGLGDEPAEPGVRGLYDLVDRVEDALRDKSTLVAQSMGGVAAIAAALRRPERVERLVLTATSGGLDLRACPGQDWRPDYYRRFPKAAPWIAQQRFDFSGRLPMIRVKTLLIWSDADPISPLPVGERLSQLLPNARLRVVSGGAHAFVQERPEEVARLLLEDMK